MLDCFLLSFPPNLTLEAAVVSLKGLPFDDLLFLLVLAEVVLLLVFLFLTLERTRGSLSSSAKELIIRSSLCSILLLEPFRSSSSSSSTIFRILSLRYPASSFSWPLPFALFKKSLSRVTSIWSLCFPGLL